jgi:hypothetical protein
VILSALFILAVFLVVVVILCGALGVWMRDEHPPIWIPPEPRHVREIQAVNEPLAYDWEKQDAEWLAKFLEEHTDDARRPPD